jgi:hypothetical protein
MLMLLGVGLAGLLVVRSHDRFDLAGRRQDGGPGGDRGDRQREAPRPGAPGLRDGQGGLGSLLGGTALHGTVTMTVNGALQTLMFQRGEVTAVSATSITLKSSDGFTGTYRRNATTSSLRSEPVRGGQALVLARSSDKVAITIRSAPA